MTKVTRNDVFVRGEKGGEWFDEFLKSFAKDRPSSVQDILSAINNKRGETVESVVQNYREQVGLDAFSSTDDSDDTPVKNASAPFRPLSKRHAAEVKSVVEMIKKDEDIQAAIDSHCEHSGGNKNTHTLIHFLRQLLGGDVSFSDNELKEYLEERKNQFKDDKTEKSPRDVGLIGTDPHEHHDDDIADFMKNDGAK